MSSELVLQSISAWALKQGPEHTLAVFIESAAIW